ncbi:MAG: hypothetical protein LBJ91_04995 [Clostridiales Family XIII bacterium]|nr:hypothetical protein [Clostridiales Family XIII bacterium]
MWACRDIGAASQPWYTLLSVFDRETAKKILTAFQDSDKNTDKPPYIRSFLQGEELCFLFPYHAERPLAEFAEGQITTPAVREAICVNLILACLESPLPWPLLFLAFDQDKINVEKDNGVFLSTTFDLTQLNASVSEADCVGRCAEVMLRILRLNQKKRLKSYELLNRKVEHGAYTQFSEVYHDFRLTGLRRKKRFRLSLISAFVVARKDIFFRILLVFSVVCAVVAAVMLISYLAVGSFPLFKLFGQSMDMIGTEQLNVK